MELDFSECYTQVQHGEVSIYWKDHTLLYKEVHCNPQDQVKALHHSIRSVMNHCTIPNHLPLFTIEERNEPLLMVKCGNSDPISKVKIDWCFEKVLIPDDTSASKVMYMTVQLKKFVFSVVHTVVAFVGFPFRPILDFRCMYIGEDNNVVFTHYESRCQIHDWANEAKELSELFNTLAKNKARKSTTIREEIKSFGKSLIKFSHQQLLGNPNLIFQSVVFWGVEMRIMFVIELHDLMVHNIINLYPTCKDAFVNPNDDIAIDFREMIRRSNIEFLKRMLLLGDKDYLNKVFDWTEYNRNAPPSALRSDRLGSHPSDILKQGLTRIRDAYRHAFGSTHIYYSLEEIQHMFQHIFPKHMIEFANLQSSLSFNVVSGVNALLSAPSLKSFS